MNTPARLYTTAEAAQMLHMSPSWLARQVLARKVHHVRLGRAVRFTDEHLALIIAEREQAVTTRGGKRSRL